MLPSDHPRTFSPRVETEHLPNDPVERASGVDERGSELPVPVLCPTAPDSRFRGALRAGTDDRGSLTREAHLMAIPIRKVLDDARAVLGQHPELGRTTTIARSELVDQVQARVRVGRHTFETDEAEVAFARGGEGLALRGPDRVAARHSLFAVSRP